MPYPPALITPVPGLLLAVALLTLGACTGLSTSTHDDAYVGPARSIAFAEVDRRAFTETGLPVRTPRGSRVTVEASAAGDTLLWFVDEVHGAFEQAFLRRGNSVYALGQSGDFQLATTSQTVVYSTFMASWHRVMQTRRAETAAKGGL